MEFFSNRSQRASQRLPFFSRFNETQDGTKIHPTRRGPLILAQNFSRAEGKLVAAPRIAREHRLQYSKLPESIFPRYGMLKSSNFMRLSWNFHGISKNRLLLSFPTMQRYPVCSLFIQKLLLELARYVLINLYDSTYTGTGLSVNTHQRVVIDKLSIEMHVLFGDDITERVLFLGNAISDRRKVNSGERF